MSRDAGDRGCPGLSHALMTLFNPFPALAYDMDSVGEGPQTVGQRGLKRLALSQGSGNRPGSGQQD